MMQDIEVSTIASTVDPQPSYASLQPDYIQSDWAILNGTTPEHLQRILTQRTDLAPDLTAADITQSCALLTSYQAVYRSELLKLRSEGYRGQCPSPTAAQLQQISRDLNSSDSSAQVHLALQAIAQRLRQTRWER